MSKYSYKQSLMRQKDLIPLETLESKLNIIGAGAIGSWVTLSCAKMGMSNLYVWDDDTVDVENMNSQMYPIAAIGEKKVVALKELVKQFTNIPIRETDGRILMESNAFTLGGNITVSAVDSMEARSTIFAQCNTRWLIDPRMGAEKALLYVVDMTQPKERAWYRKTLYSDSEAVREDCTAKATIYCANILAGFVVSQIKNILVGNTVKKVTSMDIPSISVE